MQVSFAKNQTCYATIDLRGFHEVAPLNNPLSYVNLSAPKGGQIEIAINGQFNSLNPFILKGIADRSIFSIYETLMDMREDVYKLHSQLATCVSIDSENQAITFKINPKAKWHDGMPLTAHDVAFTMNFLKEKGHPLYHSLYNMVEKTLVKDDLTVTFMLTRSPSTEDLFTLAKLIILPEHFWKNKNLQKDSSTIPLGSGPYRLDTYQEGRFLIYQKVNDYWGRHLAVSQGRYNFDTIRYEYISDRNVERQAVFAGDKDIYFENVSKEWATQYSPQKNNEYSTNTLCMAQNYPSGMQAFQFNLRKSIFQDKDLRRLISDSFDFEFSNSRLFYNQYSRLDTFFGNTELNGQLDILDSERPYLKTLKSIPASALEKYEARHYLKYDTLLAQITKDLKVLLQKGYTLKDGKLMNPKGQPIHFSILTVSPAFERILLAFAQNLKLVGIIAEIEKVIPSQYTRRIRQHQFDMIINSFSNDGWPVEEVNLYWHSQFANQRNSQNHSGLKDAFVDELLSKMSHDISLPELSLYMKLLDRYLLNEYIIIPQWFLKYERVLSQKRIHFTQKAPPFGVDLNALWIGKKKTEPFMKNCPTL